MGDIAAAIFEKYYLSEIDYQVIQEPILHAKSIYSS